MAKYNRVPDGRIGTGEAQVFGESRSLDNLLNTIEQNRKQGLLNVRAQAANSAQMNKDFLDNQLKAKSGVLFQPELDALSASWVDNGAKYRAQGFNPFAPDINDPAQVKASSEYINDKNRIERLAETRDIHQKNFLDQQSAYEKGGYDEDSWTAINDLYKNTKLADIAQSGMLPPTLQKQFDRDGFMKAIAAPTIKKNTINDKTGVEITSELPNADAIRYNVEAAYTQGTPQAKRFFNKQFGVDESKTPVKMIIGTTDPVQVEGLLDQFYNSKAGLSEVVNLFAKSGQVPSVNSPLYKEFLKGKVEQQLEQEQRYDRGMNALVQEKIGGLDTSVIKDYNFALENQGFKRQDQAMQQSNFALDQQIKRGTIADRKEKKTAENIRDMNIQGVQLGNREQMDYLRGLAGSRGGKVAYLKDGTLRVDWKESQGGETKTITKDIDVKNANDRNYAEINELLTRLTGKKQDLETMQGKTPYSGAIVNIGGEYGLSTKQVENLRTKFKGDFKSMGDMFYDNKLFKSRKEAYEAAAEILDKKGKNWNVNIKQNE